MRLGKCFWACRHLSFAPTCADRHGVGGYTQKPDWPKLGTSLLIATALIVAIRTAKWPTYGDCAWSDFDLNR